MGLSEGQLALSGLEGMGDEAAVAAGLRRQNGDWAEEAASGLREWAYTATGLWQKKQATGLGSDWATRKVGTGPKR